MNEKDIKIKVFEYLIKSRKHDVVVPEVSFGHSTKMNMKGSVRADVFAINGDITVYEVKSELDSLDRLPNQIKNYLQYANHVNVVVADKFLDKLSFLPDSVGVFSYTKRGIKCVRESTYSDVATDKYLEYWWGIELKKIFRGTKDSNKLHLDAGIEKMRDTLNDEQIKNLTLFRLKERYRKESDNIKNLIIAKKYDELFPKRIYEKNMEVTPLLKIPFGEINKLS